MGSGCRIKPTIIKDKFADWIKHNIKRYDFIEGQDYVCYSDLSNKCTQGGMKDSPSLLAKFGEQNWKWRA
jgi:hypothetical protein